MSGMHRLLVFLCAASSVWSQATARITGRVTDETDRGIPGQVTAVSSAGAVRMTTVQTDELGRFALDVAPGAVLLTASSDGYASRQHQMTGLPGANSPVTLAVSPAGSVSGIVVDASGVAIRGARV